MTNFVQEETCDGSTFQEFCTTGVETNSKWSKTCSFPKTIRAQVLAQVFKNTREEENLIEVSQPIVSFSTIQLISLQQGSQDFSFRTLRKRRQDMRVMFMSMNRRTG